MTDTPTSPADLVDNHNHETGMKATTAIKFSLGFGNQFDHTHAAPHLGTRNGNDPRHYEGF